MKDLIKKHEVSFTEYIQNLVNIAIQFENILGDEYKKNRKVSNTIAPIQQKVAEIIDKSNSRINHILNDFLKQLKNLQKIIKEKEYIVLDLKKYSGDNKKLKEKQKLQDKEYKRLFENERKIEETMNKHSKLTDLLKDELPSFLLLSDKIGKYVSIFIFFYIHDLYLSLYDIFMLTKNYFPNNNDLSNFFFEGNTYKIKEEQNKICKQIESFQLFNKYTNIYNVLQKPSVSPPEDISESVPNVSHMEKTGFALFDFDAQEKSDLSFKKGDCVVVLEESASGWWKGRLLTDGSVGVFPSNYFLFK